MAPGDYYVIYEDDQWKVKIGGGAVVSAGHRKQKAAKRKAVRLGKRNSRGVVVNAREGYTRYRLDVDEL